MLSRLFQRRPEARNQRRQRTGRRPRFESLESRSLLAANVLLNPTDGSLTPDQAATALVSGPLNDARDDAAVAAFGDGADASVSATKVMAGFIVTTPSGPTFKNGGTATFTVALASMPTSNVTVKVKSNSPNEGKPDQTSLTFTPDNWNLPQTVTVTGQADGMKHGTKKYDINLGPSVSADRHYHGKKDRVALENQDPMFVVTPTKNLSTTELGGSTIVNVVLNCKPQADVTIAVSSDDASEGAVSAGSLTFTPDNWNIPQSVTITGQSGNGKSGNVKYSVNFGPATSNDLFYDGEQYTLSLTNEAAVQVKHVHITTTEDGGGDSYTLVLIAPPTGNVTIPIKSSNSAAGTTNTASVTFTPANWNVPQKVVVTGHDTGSRVDVKYTIADGPIASADPQFNGLLVEDVKAVNQPGLEAFDGSYSGSFNGTTFGFGYQSPVSGQLTLKIDDGFVTGHLSGAVDTLVTGRIDASGHISFQSPDGSFQFDGNLTVIDQNHVIGGGSWSSFNFNSTGLGGWSCQLSGSAQA